MLRVLDKNQQNDSTQQTDYNQDKLLFLDGVRGFAALFVLIAHCLSYIGCEDLPMLQKGGSAVSVFIIMSGFLMAYHYHRRADVEPWSSPKTWKTFFVRRFFRIAPLYYVLLIFSFTFNDYFAHNRELINTVFPYESFEKVYGGASNFFDHKYMGPTLPNILLHVTFLFGLLPDYATSTPMPDWSIGLEMQFYALFPFIMIVFRRMSYAWTTVALVGLGLLAEKFFRNHLIPPGFATAFPLPSFLFLKIDLFVIGILLASAYHYRHKIPSMTSLLVVLSVILSARNNDSVILWVCILISLMLFYEKSKDLLKIKKLIYVPEYILSNKLATFMADTSYSVYLTHTLIAVPFTVFLSGFPFYVSLPSTVRFIILFLAVVPVTYGLSWLLFNYIERPGIWIGKKAIKTFH
jgi:peptidoglycan/LPS O-acetylase OafA/YrhL